VLARGGNVMCMDESAMQIPLWLSILSSLASGLITYAISTYFYLRYEERKQKIEVFRQLMATRHGLVADHDPEVNREFFKALNESFAVFGKSPTVLESIMNFKNHPNRASDNFTLLARAICNDLKIPNVTIKDEFFNEPFVPRKK
jgi:hypothetical protein